MFCRGISCSSAVKLQWHKKTSFIIHRRITLVIWWGDIECKFSLVCILHKPKINLPCRPHFCHFHYLRLKLWPVNVPWFFKFLALSSIKNNCGLINDQASQEMTLFGGFRFNHWGFSRRFFPSDSAALCSCINNLCTVNDRCSREIEIIND